MVSLSCLEALLLDITSYLFNPKIKKAKSNVYWLIRMHIKEKPLQSDPFDWP